MFVHIWYVYTWIDTLYGLTYGAHENNREALYLKPHVCNAFISMGVDPLFVNTEVFGMLLYLYLCQAQTHCYI